ADLEAGGEDVGGHGQLLVADALRRLVVGGVGERAPHVLGLGAVDLVAEDPAAAVQALAVGALPAVAAGAPRADAGHEHLVADLHVPHAGPDLLDGAHGLVAEDAPVGHGGHVPLQDVEVGAADGHGVDPHDGVGVVLEGGVRDLLPGLPTGTVVDDRTHGASSGPS